MHLVEISTKSTKNMGYAQVTQSPYFLPLKTPLQSLKTQNWIKSQFFWDTLWIQYHLIKYKVSKGYWYQWFAYKMH